MIIKLYLKKKNLPDLSTSYRYSVEFILCSICTLAYRYFWIYKNWSKSHTNLLLLKEILLKMDNTEKFFQKTIHKTSMQHGHNKDTIPTLEKKLISSSFYVTYFSIVTD